MKNSCYLYVLIFIYLTTRLQDTYIKEDFFNANKKTSAICIIEKKKTVRALTRSRYHSGTTKVKLKVIN